MLDNTYVLRWSCCCSVTKTCPTLWHWPAACQTPLSSTISWSLLKVMSIELVMPCNPSYPLFTPSPFAFNQGLFQWVDLASGGQSIGASASASVLPLNIQGWFLFRLTGLISFLSKRLKSFLQLRSSKASILHCSALFMIQLSHPYMTTGKTIALTRWIFVGKVTSLVFIHCLGWSWLFFQGVSVFQFHGCSHHLQRFWSPRK